MDYEKTSLKAIDITTVKISIASPQTIRDQSFGEVIKPEIINYKTLEPERDGLFCEKIFGPTKDWECRCEKYKHAPKFKGKICDRCGVEITKSIVRRERMGHIELGAPVAHICFLNEIGFLLDLPRWQLIDILYFKSYIVIDPGNTSLQKKEYLSKEVYRLMCSMSEEDFDAETGAEAIKKLLAQVDCGMRAEELRLELEDATGFKKRILVRSLGFVEGFIHSGDKPEWMILDHLPIIPPELRPIFQLDGSYFAISNLNDFYINVIKANNTLKKHIERNCPDIIINNDKRILQETVDALINDGLIKQLGNNVEIDSRRFGELEVWALETYRACTPQEDPIVKTSAGTDYDKTSENVIESINNPPIVVFEPFKVLVKKLQSLCLDVKIFDSNGMEIALRENCDWNEDITLLFSEKKWPPLMKSSFDVNTSGDKINTELKKTDYYDIEI